VHGITSADNAGSMPGRRNRAGPAGRLNAVRQACGNAAGAHLLHQFIHRAVICNVSIKAVTHPAYLVDAQCTLYYCSLGPQGECFHSLGPSQLFIRTCKCHLMGPPEMPGGTCGLLLHAQKDQTDIAATERTAGPQACTNSCLIGASGRCLIIIEFPVKATEHRYACSDYSWPQLPSFDAPSGPLWQVM